MKILKETNEEVVKLDIEFVKDEKETLLWYGITNIPIEEYKNMMIEWAFIDAIKRQLK